MTDAMTTDRVSTLAALAQGSTTRKAAIVVCGSLALGILAQITVPFYPVPMTLQTLGVMLIGLTFGFRMAAATLALYLVEGLCGLPVFANFGAGPAVLMAGTGGYLIGFLAAAAAMGYLTDRGLTRGWLATFVVLAIGETLIFGFGLAYLTTLYGLDKAVAFGFTPFILGDLVKMALAALIGRGVLTGAAKLIGR